MRTSPSLLLVLSLFAGALIFGDVHVAVGQTKSATLRSFSTHSLSGEPAIVAAPNVRQQGAHEEFASKSGVDVVSYSSVVDDRLTVRSFDPTTTQHVYTMDLELPIDTGFIAGTNDFLDRSKAAMMRMPYDMPGMLVDEVRVWFGYKRSGTDERTYILRIYDVNEDGQPARPARYEQTFSFADIVADESGDEAVATVHHLDQPVAVNGAFFVSIDFGRYERSQAADVAVATGPLLEGRVYRTWEQWFDGGWHNLSDTWDLGTGRGMNGIELWIEAEGRSQTSHATSNDAFDLSGPSLEANYPNPFAGRTTIPFSIDAPSHVKLSVYDLTGREIAVVADGAYPAGRHHAEFDGADLPSGVYVYRMTAGSFSDTGKLVLRR